MKKMLFILVALLLAAPAWADVNITGVQPVPGGVREVIVSFDARSEPNLVRAISLNIQADDANIVDVVLLSPDYVIHPGTIAINTLGQVTDYGSPVAPESDLPSDTLPGLGSNGVTIEMASLYAPVIPASPNAPDPCGFLVSVTVDADCCLTITANVSRAGSSGVVMESPDEVVTVNLPVPLTICVTGLPPQCLKITDPGYNTWLALLKPECWCYRHQCQGDADGLAVFGRYVGLSDLTVMKDEFGKTVVQILDAGGSGCGDFDHLSTFGRPVGLSDLTILKANFGVSLLADCPMTHINNYLEP